MYLASTGTEKQTGLGLLSNTVFQHNTTSREMLSRYIYLHSCNTSDEANEHFFMGNMPHVPI